MFGPYLTFTLFFLSEKKIFSAVANVKKNKLTAGYKKHVEQEKNECLKIYKEFHYL